MISDLDCDTFHCIEMQEKYIRSTRESKGGSYANLCEQLSALQGITGAEGLKWRVGGEKNLEIWWIFQASFLFVFEWFRQRANSTQRGCLGADRLWLDNSCAVFICSRVRLLFPPFTMIRQFPSVSENIFKWLNLKNHSTVIKLREAAGRTSTSLATRDRRNLKWCTEYDITWAAITEMSEIVLAVPSVIVVSNIHAAAILMLLLQSCLATMLPSSIHIPQ